MNTDNYDIYFPHLGIGVEHLGNSISVFGFRIAYYGIIIGIGMLMGVLIASFDYKRRCTASFSPFSVRVPTMSSSSGTTTRSISGRSSTSGRAVSPSMAAS